MSKAAGTISGLFKKFGRDSVSDGEPVKVFKQVETALGLCVGVIMCKII